MSDDNFAIIFKFPSGEDSVERFDTLGRALAAATEAAQETPGRVVEVLERVQRVSIETRLVWETT